MGRKCIVYKNINELKPYEKNQRNNNEAVECVANSIKQFNFQNPIIIDKNNVIVAGHTRYKACKKLGIKEVPCVVADDLTDDQIKAYRLADNKVSEIATWDFDLLNDELSDLVDFDMSAFGFDLGDTEQEEVEEDNFDVDENIPEEPKAKYGDIYQLGNHRLMCGDSTSIDDVEKLMDGNKADMVFTDSPYGVDYKGINNDDRKGLEELLNKAFNNMHSNSNEGASVYCFHSDRCADIFNSVFRKYCHFSSMIIWKNQALYYHKLIINQFTSLVYMGGSIMEIINFMEIENKHLFGNMKGKM